MRSAFDLDANVGHGRKKEPRFRRFFPLLLGALARVSPFLICSAIHPQSVPAAPAGLAWDVKGPWLADGKGGAIASGDTVRPGTLLVPGEGGTVHSINILLPDGQRFFYECYAAADCARGFRVPLLYRRPDPFAVQMLALIRAGLLREKQATSAADIHHRQQGAKDEILATIGPDHMVELGGITAKLPNGHYTYNLRFISPQAPRQFRLPLEKTAPTIRVALPAAGLYEANIVDDQNTPRIDLFVAAVLPAEADRLDDLFNKAKDLIADWNGDYAGWPVHEFRRAYLESIVMGLRPAPMQTSPGQKLPPQSAVNGPAAEEPKFSPRPGVLKGDTAISLSSSTPGAEIRFTVDGSQPLGGSPTYHAPIMVRGTELTVKAYASAPGKKDSPVVTGIFRIAE